MALFSTLLLFIVPALASELSGVALPSVGLYSLIIAAQVFAFIALPGLAAVVELAQRAGGTPYPADPSRRLVSTGPYAFLSNPMQATGTVLLLAIGIWLWYWPLLLASAVALGFSATWFSLAETKSDAPEWEEYRSTHRAWVPRSKPVFRSDYNAAVFFDGGCAKCREVGDVFAALDPIQIDVRDARFAHGKTMHRVTYRWWIGEEPDWDNVAENSPEYSYGQLVGVRAIGAGLDHINLLWTSFGWALRLWPVSVVAQWVSDTFIEAPHAALKPTGSERQPWSPQVPV